MVEEWSHSIAKDERDGIEAAVCATRDGVGDARCARRAKIASRRSKFAVGIGGA